MKRITMMFVGCGMALALMAGCTTQLSQQDRALLNQALEASTSASASASKAEAAATRAEAAATRAEAAADRAQTAAQRAEDAAAAAALSAQKCEQAFAVGQRKK